MTELDYRALNTTKWSFYDEDVTPLWIADMDFPSPVEVGQAIAERALQGCMTYRFDDAELREVLAARMARLYHWHITPDDVIFVPGLVATLFASTRIFGGADGGILMQPPIYPPFIYSPMVNQQPSVMATLVPVRDGARIHYEIDFDALRASITPRTRVFMLCNPHNPVGRAYTRAELEQIAEISLEHNLTILSDEIHCDLILDDVPHIPIASIAPEVAARTMTMMAPSKTFNIAGLMLGFAIMPNEEMRKTYTSQTMGVLPHVNALALVGAKAAYQHGQTWLSEIRDYLRANRDYLVSFVENELPGVGVTCPEATYLAWLDFNTLGLPDNEPQKFLLEKAHVALSAGKDFGKAGEGFARLNFACKRETLEASLMQIKQALGI